MKFKVTWVVFWNFIFLSSTQAYRQFDRYRSSDSSSDSRPLTNRLRTLPPRYSQHYFQPFQPIVESESKTHISIPTNASNVFGSQSYWGHIANKLIDNVVGQVGGSYAAPAGSLPSVKKQVLKNALKELAKPDTTLSDEKLETFRKALRMENITRLQYNRYPNFERKTVGMKNYVSVEDLNGERGEDRTKTEKLKPVEGSPTSVFNSIQGNSRESTVPTELGQSIKENDFDTIHEASIPATFPRRGNSPGSTQEAPNPTSSRPKVWRDNERVKFIDQQSQQIISSAEIVRPTIAPSTTLKPITPHQYYYPQQTTAIQSPAEYGVLPTLLLRNPNARTKFYHLDKYANPQFPIRKIIKPMTFAPPEFKGKDNLNPAVIAARKRLQELRRKPTRYRVSSTSKESSSGFDDSISNQIRFRSALKKILAEFRKTHPMSSRAREREEIQLQRLAQEKAARSNRRRHPGQRRVVMLPARYESNEEFSRWRN